jgi:tetratricopeptide (TPR) repeat protein
LSPCGLRCAASGIFLLLSATLHADTLVLKNGQQVTGKTFARQGDAIIVLSGPDGGPMTAAPGTPLAEIAKVEVNPPAVLKTAPALLAAAKASKVLAEVDSALKVAETFGELPGSHWPDLLVLRAYILVAMAGDDEAAKMAKAMNKTKNAELVREAQALLALIAARKGEHGEAASLLESLTHEAARPRTIAAAAVVRGLGLLAKKQFPEALKAFLELPVFLPDETALCGIAQLGAAQAYYGMEDYDRAIAALESLLKTRPGSPEIDQAQALLPDWKRRRRAIDDAKEP